MADPLSMTASIIGIIGVTGQGIGFLSDTIQNIRNAPDSIKMIQTGLQQLKPLLVKLEFTIKEEPTELLLCSEIRDALESCNRACTEFNVSLTHRTRHSRDDKTSIFDNAKIGVFRQGRMRLLNEQVSQSIKILNVTLDTATFLKLSRQDHIAKEFGDQMLVQLEGRLVKSIDEALNDRMVATRFEQSILPLDETEEKQGLVRELERQKAMIDAVERTSKEALKAAVFQRTKQKIHDVNATDSSIALTGFINAEGEERNREQDISQIHANGRSISIAGVANNIDINSMFANMRS
ncbi:hypothetical protein LB507_008616 [Fusarium sp. FIESC RH6]|nr:hypothetical protein LB507_008616 [Fusarium sp. FIESC RH6]